jgi:hypothetical protein
MEAAHGLKFSLPCGSYGFPEEHAEISTRNKISCGGTDSDVHEANVAFLHTSGRVPIRSSKTIHSDSGVT